MTNFSNIIRNINRRVDSIVNIFGMDSKEYSSIKSAIKKSIPDVLVGEGQDGRIRLVGKAEVIRKATKTPYRRQRFAERLNDAFYMVKNLGTARQMAEKYTGKKNLSKSDYAMIRQKATASFKQSLEEETFYSDVYSKLDEDDKDHLVGYWTARAGTHGEEADRLYHEAVQAVKDYIAEKQSKKAEDYIEESEDTAEGESLSASSFLGV